MFRTEKPRGLGLAIDDGDHRSTSPLGVIGVPPTHQPRPNDGYSRSGHLEIPRAAQMRTALLVDSDRDPPLVGLVRREHQRKGLDIVLGIARRDFSACERLEEGAE